MVREVVQRDKTDRAKLHRLFDTSTPAMWSW
jgi:hypothetical protein